MKSVTTHDAKTRLSALLKEVERGEEIEIRRGAVAVARLAPVRGKGARAPSRPRTGTVTSTGVRMAPDAFEPLGEAELGTWGLV